MLNNSFLRILFVSLIVLATSGCGFQKWQDAYVVKNITRLQIQYGKNGELSLSDSKLEPYKQIKYATRKETKAIFRAIEISLALVPDSTLQTLEKIDSFYLNIYKVKYLTNHHLKSNNMIFVDIEKNKTL